MAVAVNACCVPFANEGALGVMAILVMAAFVTVKFALALTPPTAAVMVVVPAATPVTTPTLPLTLLMVATEVVREAQLTEPVISCEVLSE